MGTNLKALFISSLISSVMVLASWFSANYIPESMFLRWICLATIVPGILIASIFKNTWAVIHNYIWLMFVCSFVFYAVVFFFVIKLFFYIKRRSALKKGNKDTIAEGPKGPLIF